MELSKTKQAKRKHIIDTTLQLIMEKGVVATTVKDIAAKAEIDRKTFYNYFADINDVINNIVEDYSSSLWQDVPLDYDSNTGLELLQYYMTSLFDKFLSDKIMMVMSLHFDYAYNDYNLFMGARNIEELKTQDLYKIVEKGLDDGSINLHGQSIQSFIITLFVPLFSGMQKYFHRQEFFSQSFETSIEDMKRIIQIIIRGVGKE